MLGKYWLVKHGTFCLSKEPFEFGVTSWLILLHHSICRSYEQAHFTVVLSGKTDMWWIGLRAHGNEHGGVEYVWDNGLPVTFTHWDRDQPGERATEQRRRAAVARFSPGGSRPVSVHRQRRRLLRGHDVGAGRRLLGRQAVCGQKQVHV